MVSISMPFSIIGHGAGFYDAPRFGSITARSATAHRAQTVHLGGEIRQFLTWKNISIYEGKTAVGNIYGNSFKLILL